MVFQRNCGKRLHHFLHHFQHSFNFFYFFLLFIIRQMDIQIHCNANVRMTQKHLQRLRSHSCLNTAHCIVPYSLFFVHKEPGSYISSSLSMKASKAFLFIKRFLPTNKTNHCSLFDLYVNNRLFLIHAF